ncbi:MAG: hypothetical protein FWE24_02215 [Defluviitaleaceae bacterium]|nr:hypothetical protein [Defluviitaleaceae bacterium]
MFYYENSDGSFEKLIQDYISSSGKIGYEIGKGWPHFSLSDLEEETKGVDGQEYGFNPALAEMEAANIIDDIPQISTSFFEEEMGHMRNLMGELTKKIIPAIDEVLNDYDYEGSPLFEEPISDKLFCEIVEKTMQQAAFLINNVREIMLETKGGAWDRRDLLYCIFEEIVLKEIFTVRRHHHRLVKDH